MLTLSPVPSDFCRRFQSAGQSHLYRADLLRQTFRKYIGRETHLLNYCQERHVFLGLEERSST